MTRLGEARPDGLPVEGRQRRTPEHACEGRVTFDDRTGGAYGYTYNAAGRMSEFRINGFLQAQYKCDALGRQAVRTLTSPTPVTIHSVFDRDGRRIAEYDEATGTLLREYIWNGWDPVALIEGGTVYYVRADHIGRPVFATNSTGAKVWEASYLPFGGVHTSTGNLPANRFPGQWFQSESGLHQNWMRDYDPTTGRYLQADPLGLIDGPSTYGYVGQSPHMAMDPSGQCLGPAVGLFWYCVAAAVMIYDYVTDDCYTADDFMTSLYNAINIVANPCRKLGPLCMLARNNGGKGLDLPPGGSLAVM
ncbi:MAG TPA: RHS repeat-associated core domain-containing protein [Tabrizicola sp.]|nr:RHS repeat-associated core domain-containing protein [Tabrizicola sp.]